MIAGKSGLPFRLIPVLIAVFTLAACGGAADRYSSHLERGKQFLADGNLDKAGIELRSALQIRPNSAEAQYLAGKLAERRGDLRGAARGYKAATTLQSDYPAAAAGLGRVYVLAHVPKLAVTLVEPLIAKHPDDADLLTTRAAARYQLDDKTGALTDTERALKIDPADENATAILAAMLSESKDYPRAIEVVRAALQRAPTSTDLHQILANLYASAGQPDKAAAELHKLLDSDPHSLQRRQLLAQFYVAQRQPDAAEQVLEEGVRVDATSSAAKLALVDFIATNRSRVQAESVLQKFVSERPGDQELQVGLGNLLLTENALQRAEDAYNAAIRIKSTGPVAITARNRVATIEASLGHDAQAAREIEQVLAESPHDNDALTIRARLALAHNNPQAAVGDLRAVLRDQPSSVPVRLILAQAYRATGELALAEDTLRAAMEVAPGDLTLHTDLADLLIQTGRSDKAVALLEEAVRRNPTDPNARVALVRAELARPDFVQAQALIDDLVKLRPDTAAGPYLRGLIAGAQNHLDEAETQFKRALTLEPSAMDALEALTDLEIRRGRTADARSRLQSVVERNPSNAVARNLLGRLYLQSRDYPRAITELTVATHLTPRWNLPYLNLVSAQLGTGDVAQALVTCQAGLQALPQDPSLVMSLASLYERQGRINDAIAQYEALHSNNPRQQTVENNLAMLLVNYRSDSPSLAEARQLTDSFASSSDGALLDTYGWVRLKSGDVAAARPALERAAERLPGSRAVRFHLAMSQLKSGEREQARANLERALGGDAAFDGINEARTALASLTNSSS
ncbi:MAG TPA: tetratricopeptide repeat protein [Steroidobacteraceae bacterium]|nr:tetratricopeptide repeat protein [Steroidobacteraceae bacterium]